MHALDHPIIIKIVPIVLKCNMGLLFIPKITVAYCVDIVLVHIQLLVQNCVDNNGMGYS